ncbi:MAG: response regulator transcription factor [Candidatus Eremiobacteraeota bacterium]|nr:response regulator transcription factor [Candidatus Eremiobacteraeota bacterium]MCW5872682.1 response regulator transcription factor [Candidatus Eremiobacteraeota bacterium]
MSKQILRALVVDDEPAVRRFLRTSLEPRGYHVSEASSGGEAIEKVAGSRPDVILLDMGLPDLSGVEVTRILREWCSIPILVLSVRDGEADKVAALDAGADDYLTKPFGLNELLARVRAALRRVQQNPDEPVLVSGGLSIDLTNREVLREGIRVVLTPTEYDILKALARKAGKVLTHQQLMREVWGHVEQDLHTLRVNISNLRKKIEPEPGRPVHLLTEPGVGYRFVLVGNGEL